MSDGRPSSRALDLVVVGNLLVDDLVYDDGQTRMGEPGGALLHAALGASGWGARVGLVSILGTDYPTRAVETMVAHGICLDGVKRLATPGARVWLLYENGVRRMVPRLGRPSHEDVSPTPEHVPAHYHDAPAMHVAPMPLARQKAMVEAFGQGNRLVSVDPCDVLTAETFTVFRAMSAHTDVLFLSDDEIGIPDRARAMRALATGRTRYVLHKRGRQGGTVYRRDRSETIDWAPFAADEVDPTGAGDSFAAAFMAALSTGASLEVSLQRAALTASIAVSGVGSESLRGLDRASLERRLSGT